MPRILGSLALLVALSGHAADVPLSDRPLAPLPVQNVAASASPDAVLIVFSDNVDLYAQRVHPDGSPIDPTAFFLAKAPQAKTVWDGARWLVFIAGPPAQLIRIDRSGAIDGPHALDLTTPYFDVAIAGGRTLVAARDWASGGGESVSVYELAEGPSLRPAGPTIRLDEARFVWPAAINDSPALVTQRFLWGTDPFRSAIFSVTSANQTSDFVVPVPSGASNVRFLPSRSSGGLFLWNDGGMRGAILRPDGTISAPFPIGPAAIVRDGILTSPRDGGYDVLFQTETETWIARVAESGAVDARPLATDVASLALYPHALASDGELALLISVRALADGIEFRTIEGGLLGAPSLVGIGATKQFGARGASGAGLDLVVWIEQGFDGLVLKATRIGADGVPRDGAGIVLATEGLFDSSRWVPTANDVAFDGEAFVVIWLENRGPGSRVMMQRIFPDGTASERAILADWHSIGEVDVAGIGHGRSAVTWFGRETSPGSTRSVLTLLDRGVPGAPVAVASGELGYSLPRLAASADRILAVFNDYTVCRILCESTSKPYGRMFTLDGEPLGEARLLSSNVGVQPEVVSDGEDFFVVWQKTLVRIRSDFSIGPEVALAVEFGDLSIEDGELVLEHGIVRGVYSRSGMLLRFEPRGIQKGETAAATLSRDRIVISVPAHPAQLMIRSPMDVAPGTADLAVVATGATSLPPWSEADYAFATFRIEHRGGDPVRRIEILGDTDIIVPGEQFGASRYRILDRALHQGESFEIIVPVYPPTTFPHYPGYANPRVWVMGDTVDLIPANNSDTYQRPTRSRGRAARR